MSTSLEKLLIQKSCSGIILDTLLLSRLIQILNFNNRWLRLCIKAKWLPIIDPALQFVSRQGRMKFTRPIYRFF